MSTFNEVNIECDECGEEYKGIIWTAVHAKQDPELKELLLGGELNILFCPKCSHVAYQDHFVLYQDPKAELIAYIYPPSQEGDREFLQKTMMSNFAEAQIVYPEKDRKDYDPLLVFGLESFVHMMERENLRSAQSQIAEAVCTEHHIPFVKLRPSKARVLRLMRVIPCGSETKNPSRESILSGLDKLLEKNPALDFYAGLRTAIQKDLQWHL